MSSFIGATALSKTAPQSCYTDIDFVFLFSPPTPPPPSLHQLRNLVDMCINPDPEKRPDITYVYDIAKHMKSLTQGS